MVKCKESAYNNVPKNIRGSLSAYADPDLAAQENGAWEREAEEKHCDSCREVVFDIH